MGDTIKTIQEALDYVKWQVSYHTRQVARISRQAQNGKPGNQRRLANHTKQVSLSSSLADFILALANNPVDPAASEGSSGVVSPSLHFIPEDLEGLPEELLEQLNINESDKLELEIQVALEKAGGSLPVDKILIQLYRDTKTVHQRDKLASKLYRMASKGRLIASTEHRGVYSLPTAHRVTATHTAAYDISEDLDGGDP